MSRCRCHSRKQEHRCCGPYHRGEAAPTPTHLMRSRYAAYAKGLSQYIIDTTDPEGPQWQSEHAVWKRDVARFSESTRFAGLSILEEGAVVADSATVTFTASLYREGEEVGFTERSLFRRIDGRWVYVSATPRS